MYALKETFAVNDNIIDLRTKILEKRSALYRRAKPLLEKKGYLIWNEGDDLHLITSIGELNDFFYDYIADQRIIEVILIENPR